MCACVSVCVYVCVCFWQSGVRHYKGNPIIKWRFFVPNLSLRVCMYIYEIHVHTNVHTYVYVVYITYIAQLCVLLFVYIYWLVCMSAWPITLDHKSSLSDWCWILREETIRLRTWHEQQWYNLLVYYICTPASPQGCS